MALLNLSLPQASLLGLSLPLLALLLHALLQQPIRRGATPIPKAPNTLPLLGNALHFLRPRHELLAWFAACQRRHGHATLQISVPTSRSRDLFGHGIINADGHLWKAQRRAGLAFLSAANLRVLTEAALPLYLREAVEGLGARADGRCRVDLQAVFHEITTRLMGRMAYDMEMHADDEFTLAFEYASGATAERFQNPLWRFTELLFGFRFRRALALDGGDEEKTETREDALGGISGSLVRSLLEAIGDETLVADAALNYLSAGRDTTAQGLTWTLHLLMRHPHEAAKMRREIRRILRSAGGSASEPDPSLFTPTSAPYTLAVFYEALRFYPPIPIEIKQTTAPSTLPDGTFLPKDSVLVWSPWSMNRSEITWGPDVAEFRPDRWLSYSSAPSASHPLSSPSSSPTISPSDDGEVPRFVNRSVGEFPVFNGGPRICLGKKMAELIAVQVLAVVVWSFDFVDAATPGPDGTIPERKSPISLTLPMKGGLPCFVRKRSYTDEDVYGG
ncbi:unnamed protein product [Parascedosporium putredinis]|uniref:Cytochrome P450 n=1 Tax=Parascedosporium putredinis TaxID=1442378 RepID=A0A9P1H4Z0_9PEZI|nr:unnamed protein product [Parascedosporium putredinis]CAI7996085.1 unnamed protein product [Parascedosporium putredinis]